MKNVLFSVGLSLSFGLVGYCSILLGAFVTELSGLPATGLVCSIPGFVYLIPALPLLFLIDGLPMAEVFPMGGAPAVFGSLVIFAFVIWAFLFFGLRWFKLFPFKLHERGSSETARVEK